jgi:hypothetical protein
MGDYVPHPPPFRVLRESKDVTVMRVALGLTLYLDSPGEWVNKLAAEAFTLFLELAPRDALRWFWTSAEGRWRHYDAREADAIQRALSPQWMIGFRHLLRVRVVDDRGARR